MKYLSASNAMSAPLHRRGRFDAADFQHGPVELLIMRLGFALLVFAAIKWEVASLGPADPKKLTGLAHFINLDWLSHLSPVWLWQGLTIAGLLVYIAGVAPALALFPALFFSIGIGTLANSQGAANHSTQLISMILLGQFLAYVWPRRQELGGPPSTWAFPDIAVHQKAVYTSLVIFAASYVVCGWVKLDNSDWKWIQNVPNLAVELQKSNWSEYYDTLTPVPDSLQSVVTMMNTHPNFARLIFGGGLVIELFAFLALMGRRWAFFYGILIIVFHLSVSRLMQLDFWYHMGAALIFLVNLPGIKKTFPGKKDRMML